MPKFAENVNIDKYKPKCKVENGHKIFQNPAKVLVAGVSGAGKTSFVLSLIMGDDEDCRLRFTKLYICARDLMEPAYCCIREKMTEITEFINNGLEESGQVGDVQIYYEYDHPNKIDIDMLDPNEVNCLIFDDCVLELQDAKSRKMMNEAYMRARKKGCTMIYLTQNVFHDGLKFIRMQCNEIYLFNLGSMGNIKRLASELGVNESELNSKYRQAISCRWGFIRIDLTAKKMTIGL